MQYEKSVFLSDLHVPFHSRKAFAVTLVFLRWFKPDFIYIIGDLIDFYSFSSFDKNPNRLLSVQDDLDEAKKLLKELRQTCPNAKIILKPGNHEQRLLKYLWRHPEISQLKVLNLNHLLELNDKDINVKLVEYDTLHLHHDFIITHGEKLGAYSAYTAKAQLLKRGLSGICGHCHRLGVHYHTDDSGTKVWFENGCLCEKQEYAGESTPDWQLGFTIGYWVKNNHRFICEQIPILSDKIFFAGKLFK